MATTAPRTPYDPTPDDLAGWLRGTWSVQRTINGDAGAFLGTATFTPDPESGLAWQETGTLRVDAYAGPAYRTLRLSPPAGGDHRWQVAFEDGRPFHDLDLRSGAWAAEHLCGPDRYRGRFVVRDAESFTVTWHVTGPGRDDVIASVYRRQDRSGQDRSRQDCAA